MLKDKSERTLGILLITFALAAAAYTIDKQRENNPNTSKVYNSRPDGAYISSSWQESDKVMDYINAIRANEGLKPIRWDDRAYSLAVFRAKDMDQNGYTSRTSPKTGQCAKTLKTQFGFSKDEIVFESRMNYYYPDGVFYGKQSLRSMKYVLDDYLDRKNFNTREFILEKYHEAGAIGCSGSVCAIIFSNKTMEQGECEKD